MRLLPHEILGHLGFKVPAEGIDINSNDFALHAGLLRLIGRSIDPDNMNKTDLLDLRNSLFMLSGGELKPKDDNTEALEATIKILLKMDYGKEVK